MRTNVFLAVVAGLLAVPTTITILEERSSFTQYEDVPKLFEGFTPEQVAIVRLSKVELDADGKPVEGQNGQPKSESLVLQKGADGWIVAQGPIQGAPVRTNFVAERVLAHVESIRRDSDSLVLTRADGEEGYAEKLAEFELTEELGTLIQCFDARQQPIAEVYKGRSPKKSPNGDALSGYFVRRKDRDDVILYEEAAWQTPLDAKQWIDRSIVPATDVGRVTRIALTNPFGEAEFRRDAEREGVWEAVRSPDGVGPVRNQEIENMVSRVARQRISEYVQKLPPNPAQKAQVQAQRGLAAPTVTAEIELDDGTLYKFAFGEKITDKAEYYASVSSLDFLLTLPSYAYDSLNVDVVELFDPAPSSSDENGDKDDGDENGDDGGNEDDGNRDEGR